MGKKQHDTTFRVSRIVVCRRLCLLGSAHSLLCAVNRCEKNTQSFSLGLQVMRLKFQPAEGGNKKKTTLMGGFSFCVVLTKQMPDDIRNFL